jgi:hypothetical protein
MILSLIVFTTVGRPLENFLSKMGWPDALQAILVGTALAVGFSLIVFVQRKILGTPDAAKTLTVARIGSLSLLAAFLDYMSLGRDIPPWLAALVLVFLLPLVAILREIKPASHPHPDSSGTS